VGVLMTCQDGNMRRFILNIDCPDTVGVVAAVSGFVADNDGSVIEAAQHGDLTTGRFFLRMEISADSLSIDADAFGAGFADIAKRFDMRWRLTDTDVRKRIVVLCSTEEHCLADILYRWRTGDLEADVACVISNHETLRTEVEWHGVPFHHVPVTREGRDAAFAEIGRLFDEAEADVMVLARYMQIIPPDLCDRLAGRIINIHHSFLPSFAGAKPYHQAFDRGVKLIGATCHYVTATLDDGPIIEQDTRRIDHADSPTELVRLGRDIERTVLARGLRWHLEDRVFVNANKTVVFA